MNHPSKAEIDAQNEVSAYEVGEDRKAKPPPNWAPDGCPPNVVKLIEDEQYLEDLGLRGLASSDSAELHQALRNLQRQLGDAFERGKSRGMQMRADVTPWSVPPYSRRVTLALLGVGWLLGALCGAAVLALFGP